MVGEPEQTTAQGGKSLTRCILVHGFNGEPVDMCEVERTLGPRGFATTTMLLRGHGTTVGDFAMARWEHWIEAVSREVREALDRGERVILVGHSMGGALAFAVAAHEPRVAGVVALCAPLSLDSSLRGGAARRHRLLRYYPSLGEDVRDRLGAWRRYERRAYKLVPMVTVQSLFGALCGVREVLPQVRCPSLLIYARHDHVVPLADGIEAYKRVGAREKQLLVLQRSFHAVTKDVEREVVCERVAAFCEGLNRAAGGPKQPSVSPDEPPRAARPALG